MKKLILCLLVLVMTTACVAYKQQEVPFQPPAAFSNMQTVNNMELAAMAYADEKKAGQAFGFNILKAGLLPVQIVVDNKSTAAFQFNPGQTFLVDANGNYWNLLDQATAYDRLEKSSEYARIAKQAGKRSVLGAAGGAVVGAAIGILTGNNVGEAIGKGAAIGAAGGTIFGAAEEMDSSDAEQAIRRDLMNRQMENKIITPGTLARGFLFFPAEAASAGQLRLQVIDVETKASQNLFFDL
ncbi:YMGG-like glycine zipper-containing protein [Desulfosudis oleivorans]|uniref:Lipoprotein, putative n=1 Tax=Desulfosudis oleivorans (strain DSM 6200 / JCM 39069 / Hxd3) TaxID=96561 RepID=A8ZWD7_DESOH|nr:YMGG-like glycine zipper-containing protein [Desulfosudis oleivorans]ABW66745.1 lipoprotein, putative [Desulfosudis oleivorans Hxd3]